MIKLAEALFNLELKKYYLVWWRESPPNSQGTMHASILSIYATHPPILSIRTQHRPLGAQTLPRPIFLGNCRCFIIVIFFFVSQFKPLPFFFFFLNLGEHFFFFFAEQFFLGAITLIAH